MIQHALAASDQLQGSASATRIRLICRIFKVKLILSNMVAIDRKVNRDVDPV